MVYVAGAIAARLATVLCAVTIALPYALRRGRLSRGLGLAQKHELPYLRRLWPHFWIGYAILALALLHAGTVMGAMGRVNAAGIVAATAAFFLLVLEVVVGLTLKDETLAERAWLRRLHFWTMAGFAAALLVHLVLNGV